MRAVTRQSCSPSISRMIRMSARPERLDSSFRAATALRAAASAPEAGSSSGRNSAADTTPVTPGTPPSAAPTSRAMSSRSAGRIADVPENRSTTSTGTSGPMCSSSQR